MDLDDADGLRETLEPLDPAEAVGDAVGRSRELTHGVARQHLAWTGDGAQAGRTVERTTTESIHHRDCLAGVTPT